MMKASNGAAEEDGRDAGWDFLARVDFAEVFVSFGEAPSVVDVDVRGLDFRFLFYNRDQHCLF